MTLEGRCHQMAQKWRLYGITYVWGISEEKREWKSFPLPLHPIISIGTGYSWVRSPSLSFFIHFILLHESRSGLGQGWGLQRRGDRRKHFQWADQLLPKIIAFEVNEISLAAVVSERNMSYVCDLAGYQHRWRCWLLPSHLPGTRFYLCQWWHGCWGCDLYEKASTMFN